MKTYATIVTALFVGVVHAGTPTFSPATIDFGNVAVGSTKSIQVVLGLDSGSDNLRTLGVAGSSVLTNAAIYEDFSLTLDTCHYSPMNNSGSPLSTSDTCRFTLTYSPTSTGNVSAVVTVTDYQQGHWGNASVSATATPKMTEPNSVPTVPTLGEWGLITLSSLMVMFGVTRIRRRQN